MFSVILHAIFSLEKELHPFEKWCSSGWRGFTQQYLHGVFQIHTHYAVATRGVRATLAVATVSQTICNGKKDDVINLNMGKLHWIENILFVEMPTLGFELRSIFRYPIKVNCTKIVDQFTSPLSCTLDSGINVPHGITVAPPLKNFHITILILFYINLGIAVIFEKNHLQNFSKINKRTPMFILESRVHY